MPIQSADPAARRRLFWTLGVSLIAGLLLLLWAQAQLPRLSAWLLDSPDRLAEKLQLLVWVVALMSLPLLLLCGYLWRFGQRIVDAQRVPPPGSPVVVDTPVIEGAAAVSRGRMLKGLALGLLLASLALPMVFWWVTRILVD